MEFHSCRVTQTLLLRMNFLLSLGGDLGGCKDDLGCFLRDFCLLAVWAISLEVWTPRLKRFPSSLPDEPLPRLFP